NAIMEKEQIAKQKSAADATLQERQRRIIDLEGQPRIPDKATHLGSLIAAPVIATSCPVTVGSLTGFYWNNSTGACTFVLPSITTAMITKQAEFCFGNSVMRTGAVTLQLPTKTYFELNGVLGTPGGYSISSGALGDFACVAVLDATHY